MWCQFLVYRKEIQLYIYLFIFSFFPFRLLWNIEQSSLPHTGGPCWLSVFNIVCIHQPQDPDSAFSIVLSVSSLS